MSTRIGDLYHRLRKTPFPSLGKEIGDFPLYDGSIAGCASRAANGVQVCSFEVPSPDDETAVYAARLRSEHHRTAEEQAFLDYFDLLEQMRVALHDLAADR